MPFQGDELPLALNTNERRRPAYLGASLSLSFSCFFRHLAGRALSYERPPLVPTSLMQHLSLSRGAREAANRRPPFLFSSAPTGCGVCGAANSAASDLQRSRPNQVTRRKGKKKKRKDARDLS